MTTKEPQPPMEMVELLALSDKCIMIGNECIIRVDDAVDIIMPELVKVREAIKHASLSFHQFEEYQDMKVMDNALAALDKMGVK